MNAESLDTQVIILSPTRGIGIANGKRNQEVLQETDASQVGGTLYGGADYGSQSRALSKGCQVVVGTPKSYIGLYSTGTFGFVYGDNGSVG